MPRTDFTQEIDGAFATRNQGHRHFSEVARSGNGNMRRDLLADLDSYQELAGVGETTEAATIVGHPGKGPGIAFRYPTASEVPPMVPMQGKVWLRKLSPTARPGVARGTWVQVDKTKLIELMRSGALPVPQGMAGLGDLNTGLVISLGLGLVGGITLWYFLLRKKKTA